MSQFEDDAKTHYEQLGYEVLDSGWPDFLLIDKSTNKIKFVEVKALGDTLKDSQKKMLAVLSANNLDVSLRKQTKESAKDILFCGAPTGENNLQTMSEEDYFGLLCKAIQTAVARTLTGSSTVPLYQKIYKSANIKKGLVSAVEQGKQLGRPKAAIDEIMVDDMFKLKQEGKTLKEIGAVYGVSYATVLRRLRSKTEYPGNSSSNPTVTKNP